MGGVIDGWFGLFGIGIWGWTGKGGLGVHGPFGDLEIGEVLKCGVDRVDLRADACCCTW